MDADFEWDARTAAENGRKHGVSFEDAVTAFADPLAVTVTDPHHSSAVERRYILVGRSATDGFWWCPTPSATPPFTSSAPGRPPAANGNSMKKSSSLASFILST